MELNIVVEFCVRLLYNEKGEDTAWPMPNSMTTLIDSEFAAATFMITFDAIIGRASPWQLIIICISQSFFLCVQQGSSCPWIDRRRRCRRIHDHSHVWRYIGLAVSYALGAPKDVGAEASMMPDKVSDIMALIGTTILWQGELNNEQHCVISTILSLMASTTVTFYLPKSSTMESSIQCI